FLFGAGAIALAVAKMVQFDGVWVAIACVLAVIFGARALIRRRNGSATIRWAPILGILFGVAATASVFLAGPLASLVGSVFPSPTSGISATTANATSPETSP